MIVTAEEPVPNFRNAKTTLCNTVEDFFNTCTSVAPACDSVVAAELLGSAASAARLRLAPEGIELDILFM